MGEGGNPKQMLGAASANEAKIFFSSTPHKEKHCLNIIKGGKDNKAISELILDILYC